MKRRETHSLSFDQGRSLLGGLAYPVREMALLSMTTSLNVAEMLALRWKWVLQTSPPPSRLRSLSQLCRLYDLPCSTGFSVGRGRFLQLLDMSLPPCCPYHPAEVTCRFGQFAPCHAAFARP